MQFGLILWRYAMVLEVRMTISILLIILRLLPLVTSYNWGASLVQRLLLNQQLDALETRTVEVETEYQTVQQEERDIVKTLNDKYGPGQLDPATGVFTPST